jgi:hypothetical protein
LSSSSAQAYFVLKFIKMNSDRFKTKLEERWGHHRKRKDRGHIWAGAALLIIGSLLLARESGVRFPEWFFTWPMLLIGMGLFTGIRHRFNSPVPFILLIIGGIFLADNISDELSLKQYVWPIVLI